MAEQGLPTSALVFLLIGMALAMAALGVAIWAVMVNLTTSSARATDADLTRSVQQTLTLTCVDPQQNAIPLGLSAPESIYQFGRAADDLRMVGVQIGFTVNADNWSAEDLALAQTQPLLFTLPAWAAPVTKAEGVAKFQEHGWRLRVDQGDVRMTLFPVGSATLGYNVLPTVRVDALTGTNPPTRHALFGQTLRASGHWLCQGEPWVSLL
jgi:hypothetical protein